MYPIRHMNRSILVLAIAMLTLNLSALDEAEPARAVKKQPLVQLALLLDTSGSMSGMINQARTQIWAIVNEFLKAEQDGQKPRLEVALFQYGTPTLGDENGFVRQLCPLTEDLDKVAAELFKLGTNGGDEYCGWVIRTAVNELQWSKGDADYKAIFIAGNESFAQGGVDFRQSCKAAITAGIIVNTIHCSGGSDEYWKEGAALADGRFMHIDQNQMVVEIQTPYDEELARLGTEINKTYLAYGSRGNYAMAEAQIANDAASSSIGMSNFAKRASIKGSSIYKSDWDLVQNVDEGKLKLEDLKEKELPEEMRAMTPEAREAHIKELAAKRAEIQKKIQELSAKRDAYLSSKRQELADKNRDTLGDQVQSAVQEQAKAKGFTF